jgi:hypothetical protein
MGRMVVKTQLKALSDGSLGLFCPYNAGLVAGIKSLPTQARKWDPELKCWKVAPNYGGAVTQLVAQYLGEIIQAPTLNYKNVIETKLFKLEYLGAAKERDDGQLTAFGYTENEWKLIFPVEVLKKWFDPSNTSRPGEQPTLYAVLGVAKEADVEAIKKAYRRAAKQWHPDVCKEPDATEQFRRIQEAYEVLGDENKRKRYNAGLVFSASVGQRQINNNGSTWRSPLSCGWIAVEGQMSLGRFVVSKLLQWEDITDKNGRTMVSSWPVGAKHFQVQWV